MPQGLVNDDSLPHLTQDFAHRLEVKAGPGDLGRLDIFLKHRAKSRDVTLGLIDALEAITLRRAQAEVSLRPVPFKRLILRVVLRGVRPMVPNTGPPSF